MFLPQSRTRVGVEQRGSSGGFQSSFRLPIESKKILDLDVGAAVLPNWRRERKTREREMHEREREREREGIDLVKE